MAWTFPLAIAISASWSLPDMLDADRPSRKTIYEVPVIMMPDTTEIRRLMNEA